MLLKCGIGEDSLESLGLQGDQTSQSRTLNIHWITDAEVEAPILWPPDTKGQRTKKDPDAGKD